MLWIFEHTFNYNLLYFIDLIKIQFIYHSKMYLTCLINLQPACFKNLHIAKNYVAYLRCLSWELQHCCLRHLVRSTMAMIATIALSGKRMEQMERAASGCMYQLCQLSSIKRSLTLKTRCTLATAFVASHIDYCNGVLYGVAKGEVQRLQMGLNAAVRLVVGTGKFCHVTLILCDVLHWLPV